MAYRCGQAIIGRAEDPIRCKVSGTVCAHQKFCGMEGRIVLTDGALMCPARDGQMPADVPPAVPAAPDEKAVPEAEAEKKPARKSTGGRRKTK